MFVESFQGQYKDGTNGTCDFRMVSASFLILRILIVALFSNRNSYIWGSLGQTVLLAIFTCFYAIARPYKLKFMTTVDILILFLLETLSLATSYSATSNPAKAVFNVFLLPILLLSVPHILLIFYICSMLAKKAGITQRLKMKYNTWSRCVLTLRHTRQAEADVETESDTNSLPDRLINPGEYEPVLPTIEVHTAAEPVKEDPRKLTPVYTYGSIK